MTLALQAADVTFMCWAPAYSDVCVVQEGPVHDVQWAPQGGSFCVIAGYMPAQVCHVLQLGMLKLALTARVACAWGCTQQGCCPWHTCG